MMCLVSARLWVVDCALILQSVKRFERSNGLDTALYKNYLYLFFYSVMTMARWGPATIQRRRAPGCSVNPIATPSPLIEHSSAHAHDPDQSRSRDLQSYLTWTHHAWSVHGTSGHCCARLFKSLKCVQRSSGHSRHGPKQRTTGSNPPLLPFRRLCIFAPVDSAVWMRTWPQTVVEMWLIYSLRVIAAWLECFPKKPSWCRNEQVCRGGGGQNVQSALSGPTDFILRYVKTTFTFYGASWDYVCTY